MAESPFIKYQDQNNDGLPDICEDVATGTVEKCPPCVRNPNAVVPDWKKRGTQEPWFNERYCLMQCTVVTTATSLPENVDDLFAFYENVALTSLLDNFNKLSTSETHDLLKPYIQYSKYDLSPREGMPVKLLYSIPVDQFSLIEDDVPAEPEEDKEPGGPITVTYDTKDVFPKLMKFRKVMYLYARFYRVYTGVEGGNLFFEDSGAVFAHNKFDRYGDPGFFVGSSTMADVLKDLDNFLNDRNLNLYLGAASDFKYLFSFNNVVKFTMEFTSEYKLKKLKVYTVGCREKPLIFGEKRLESLNSKASFKDPTALAYFSKLNEIDTFLSARVARPWLEFVQEFTYPKVVTQRKFPSPENDNDNLQSALSCVTDNLANEAKQLGQDIIDDIFSIGDAIAYAFHKNVCKRSLGDINTELEQMGIVYKTNKKGKERVAFNQIKDPKTGETKSIAAMATSQAFEQLESDDQVFVQMCAAMLATTLPLGTSTDEIIRSLYRDGLGRIKLCGLLDLMMDAIQCLFKGLTLEQALKVALKSALKALPLNSWGELFIGLPPDKQAELDAMVQRKLAQPPSTSQRQDDVERGDDNIPMFGKIQFQKPWQNEELLERELATKRYGNYDNEVRQSSLNDPYAQKNQRTLAQKYDQARTNLSEGNNNFGINPDTVMDAYIIALIETYSNDLLALVDHLNQFPGAEIIAKIISIFDCPAPPTFDPNFADFLNSIDLPFCRNVNEIQLPMLQNPFGWLPEWSDILEKLYEALITAVQQVLLKVLFRILVKICQLIGDAICKALETVGDLAASLPDLLSGRDTISNIVRESICGPDASQAQVDATIADMFAKFGVGGAALSNHEKIKQFCEALSNATTRGECIEAAIGQPSPIFLEAGHTILVNQFPEFASAIPTQQDLADLFGNISKLMPAPARAAYQDFLDNLPANDDLPANPSLCATSEDIDAFKERRKMLLDGRATPEQVDEMFDNLQNDLLEDLDQLTSLTQGGVSNAISDALPPLISTPGCDDGILPYENEIDSAIASGLVDGVLQQLQVAYSKDMLGNGGLFAGQDDWGLMNMILADTKGRALSTHRRKSANRRDYVDYVSYTERDEEGLLAMMRAAFGGSDVNMDGAIVAAQEGQFPMYVAEHLWTSMFDMYNRSDSGLSMLSDNSSANVNKGQRAFQSFFDLGYYKPFGVLDVNLLTMPDFGYNTRFSVDMQAERVEIIKGARKETPDITLSFEDNNDGFLGDDKKKERDTPFGFGFDLKMYLSDVESYKKDSNSAITYVNRFDDNARVSIDYKTFDRQPGSEADKSAAGADFGDRTLTDEDYITERKYEFLSVDDTLDSIELQNYPHYLSTQNNLKKYIPQIYMLADLTGIEPSDSLKSFHDDISSRVIRKMIGEVCGPPDETSGVLRPTKTAWLYGATIDDLTEEDMEYVVKFGQTGAKGGTPYGKARVKDYNEDGEAVGERKIKNDDMILGISYMQFKENQGITTGRSNRVFFLDPMTYGGSYTRPKIYIKPVDNTGWLGMIDVMFPDAGPCKPQYTDLVNFKQITDQTSESYNSMPEDQRLKGDPDCVIENPYNRILMRESKATIQSLISAACRIYASVHFVKAMATFTTFNTTKKENYSSIFSAYIVERMEDDFKNAQGDFLEAFNTFKDEEFWYAFLEQAVQTYARLADEDRVDPPEPVLRALYRLNDKQEKYKYPNRPDLKKARQLKRAQKFPFQTLKGWRYEKNLDAVQATEEDAKLILKEFVAQELTVIAETFNKNSKQYNLKPEYDDLLLYMLKKHCTGTEDLDMDKEIVEEVVDLGAVHADSSGPSTVENLYTYGGELSLPTGEEYVGYFHMHEDEETGVVKYMVGEAHSDEPHDELTVFAHKIQIPIGNISSYGESPSTSDAKPFKIEKYISINGTKMHPSTAVSTITSHGSTKNISDVYPGTLKLVKNSKDEVIGIDGILGVRYGLEFSVNIGGTSSTVTTVEVDALDLKCSQMPTIEANSKLLYCLVNMLRDDEKFKILMNYVIPANKFTSLIAIYNDLGFLPSIGQVTVQRGDTHANAENWEKKPGIRATIDKETGAVLTLDATAGWQHYKDRTKGWSIGYKTWDEWDKELLRNSRSVIKRLFKPLYNSRDFEKSVMSLTKFGGGGNIYAQNLKAILSIPPGAGFLSWWDWGRLLKTSPFNGRGKLCTKNDE